MNYPETLDYLFSQLPVYQRIGGAAYKADLKNTIELCNLLENPQNDFKSIHIAGTNGKGSTSHIIASILQEAGYKTGLYTSPHLLDFRERIKINGQMIPERAVVDFVHQYKSDFEKIGLSFFEMTVGLAFYHFANEKVDIAVIETGLGGRLDSTNIIQPLVSVITNIDLDHTQFLGDTIEKIAYEKAGIIKQNTLVVIGETQPETERVFTKTAAGKNAPLVFADQIIYQVPGCDLKGNYQTKNLKTALAAIKGLKEKGLNIPEAAVTDGCARVVVNTGLLGRWQILSQDPLTICDTGHNKHGVRQVVNQINTLKFNHLHFVLGAVNDKDISEMLALLPASATYYFCKANIPRALDADILQRDALNYHLTGKIYDSVRSAVNDARAAADKNDLVFIGGSTFVVAEALEIF